MTRILGMFASLLFLSLSLLADPISQNEADAWVNHVRRINRWSSDFDVKAEAERRMQTAKSNLELHPNSAEFKRDLADALHTLGHFAEHDHNFELALSLHQQSLNLFLQSGLPTRESWDDGVDHAYEHIFMDSYDNGILLQRQGKFADGIKWLSKAFMNFVDSPAVYNGGRLGRVTARVRSFFSTQPLEVTEVIRQNLLVGTQYSAKSCRRLFL